jgi:DNA replication and repair protein RecF
MAISSIRLQQYRSYDDATFKIGDGVTIVVGPNAAGKTNLLEAILVACTGSSYRAKDVDLIKNNLDWARIDVDIHGNQRTIKLQLDQFGKLQKSFVIEEKQLKRLQTQSTYPVVLFEPNDLQLITEEPSARRAYMDNLLQQYIRGYQTHLNHYKRVLAQRNALLKRGSHVKDQLFAWNLRLADLGEYLVTERTKLLDRINQDLADLYTSLSSQDKNVSLSYISSLPTKNYSSYLLKKLEADVEKDFARGFTGSGPHRDDFSVLFGDELAVLSASRGELRTVMLALKIIELRVLEQERGIKPILLLDDVFSELDANRRKALTTYLDTYQTVITTTDADVIAKNLKSEQTLIRIS